MDPAGAVIYGAPWIPSIYPIYHPLSIWVSIYIPAPWILYMNIGLVEWIQQTSNGVPMNG
jgi:hypothetical protein